MIANVCIDANFITASAIAKLPQVVTNNCEVLTNESASKKLFEEVQEENYQESFYNFDCGEVSFSAGHVIGGTASKRGQWPFLVALYNLETNKFFCGGSLITSKNVLTGKTPSASRV